ncbi:MAG: NAD(P)H-hydrate epimerase [Planctomycetia bacterium]|nr:NAD(P)H-hydrate epimerase [Planctomycetia bacterium]
MDAPLVRTCQQTREIDRRAMEEWHIPGMVLMENAGRNLVELLCREEVTGKVVIFCAAGNNAGDGMVMARHLQMRNVDVEVVGCVSPERFRGDAKMQYEIIRSLEIPFLELADCTTAWEVFQKLEPYRHSAQWLVDALLGTGASGEPRFPVNAVIDWINRASKRVLAVDLPSGLDADTGEPSRSTVRAEITGTLAALKPGLLQESARPYVGKVECLDIGFAIPASWG